MLILNWYFTMQFYRMDLIRTILENWDKIIKKWKSLITLIINSYFNKTINFVHFISVTMADSISTCIVFITTVILVTLAYLKYQYQYWKKKKVPYLEPKFPFGNLKGFPKGIGIGKISYDFYHEFKKTGSKLGGK